jgi:NAD(P)-dependent dehydrogenase (short-subunit alcohol dehydrogenase family)
VCSSDLQAVKSARTRLLNRGQSVEAAKAAAREFTDSMQRLLAAYEKEAGSASSGVNPAAVATPAMQMGIRAYATQSGLPAEAITEFLSNPATPQEMAEFNEAFGDGAAEAILKAMQGGR